MELYPRRFTAPLARLALALGVVGAVLVSAPPAGAINPGGGGFDVPDLTIAMSDSPDPVAANGTLTYTLTINNTYTTRRVWDAELHAWLTELVGAPVGGVVVTDQLPAGVTFLSASGNNGFGCALSGSTVTCSNGYIDMGGSATLSIAVRAPNAGATLSNSATVDPNGQIAERSETNNAASATTTVTPPPPLKPDFSVSSFVDAPDPAAVNGDVTYTIRVYNAGPGSATGVRAHWFGGWGGWTQRFQGTLSGDSGFTCYVPAEYYNMEIRCVGGSLPSGATGTITIRARGPSAGGSYATRVELDPYAEILETNEGNNIVYGSTTFN
jgi:Domain of unknown function DUF11